MIDLDKRPCEMTCRELLEFERMKADIWRGIPAMPTTTDEVEEEKGVKMDGRGAVNAAAVLNISKAQLYILIKKRAFDDNAVRKCGGSVVFNRANLIQQYSDYSVKRN